MQTAPRTILWIILALLVLTTLFCNLPGDELSRDADYTATLTAVQSTQTAMAGMPKESSTPTVASTNTATIATNTSLTTGSISGSLSYPSEWIPAQRIVAFRVGGDDYYFIETTENQASFTLSGLPPGAYYVVTYLLSEDLSAGYTNAVLCGLAVECQDHQLITVQVNAGGESTNIDPVDWYAPNGSFPPNPFALPSSDAPSANTGSISGKLSYPSEGIPQLQIVAFHQDSEAFYSIETTPNQLTFQINDIPSGVYIVVAYLSGEEYAGGYTQAVLCGLSLDCTDHSLVPVLVDPGLDSADVDLMDWYAPQGTYPPNPLR